MHISGDNIPGGGHRKPNGPEVGGCLAYLGNSKEACVWGMELASKRVGGTQGWRGRWRMEEGGSGFILWHRGSH